MHLLNDTALEQAVKALQEANRIEFYRNGGSGIIAMDAYHKFMRTGISCIAHTDSHFQIMGEGLLSKNSVVIGISHSGSNKGLLEALEVAKQEELKLLRLGVIRNRH